MEGSGIHATIAGIFAAWTIPAYSRYSSSEFSQEISQILEQFGKQEQGGDAHTSTPIQTVLIKQLGEVYKVGISPLSKLESNLHIPTTYLVIPVFALANAAIPLNWDSINEASTDPIAIGIFFGLVAGKLIGITGSVYLMQKLNIGQLPDSLNFRHIIGAGFMGGIGFTMSIFISELAFDWDGEVVVIAKMSILFASIVAGICGYLWLRFFTKPSY